MLTGDENIVSLEFIVQYQVKRVSGGNFAIENYLFSVKPALNADRKNATVKEIAEAAMREVVGRHTIDNVLTEGKEKVQDECRTLMQEILDRYAAGIEVSAVNLQDVQPPTTEVRNAFKDVASAREDKVRALQEAEGYTNDLLPKARGEGEALKAAAQGYAQARIAAATGEANRFLSILKEYELARNVTRDRIYIETLEEVLSMSEKVIVDSKSAEQMVPYLPLRGELPRAAGKTQP
jgi:membrane protease subunit HflK